MTSPLFQSSISTGAPQIFDHSLRSKRRARLSTNFIHTHPLHKILQGILLERLSLIQRSFEKILIIGDFPGTLLQSHFTTKPFNIFHMNETIFSKDYPSNTNPLQGSSEFLPIKEKSMDLIISYFDLHQMNDIPGALAQIRYALKEDGLFLGILLGGDSLWQLRQTCSQAEETIRGGVSPRVAPFVSLQDAAHLMLRAGFALPVADYESFEWSYESTITFLKDLKALGLSNTLQEQHKGLMGKSLLKEILTCYQHLFSNPLGEQKGQVSCTYDIIFLSGWSPSDIQQKPLLPCKTYIPLKEVL